jgi:hypothetical protein
MDTVTPLLPPAEPPPVHNKTPAIMMLLTAADHAGPSLYAPHPTPLLRFNDTTFPTPAAYNNVPYLAHNYLFPASSFFHCLMTEQLTPPILVLNLQQQSLDFHSLLTNALAMTLGSTLYITDSITRICGQPRVFGFADRYCIWCVLATDGSLFDSGANICITNALSLLVDVVDIPPFTFSIGQDGTTPSIDDCCTKHGLLPLPMADGSLYYQPCYFCQNATEIIISPQGIVEASKTFTSWHQTGHKGDLPGSIHFESACGILSMYTVVPCIVPPPVTWFTVFPSIVPPPVTFTVVSTGTILVISLSFLGLVRTKQSSVL